MVGPVRLGLQRLHAFPAQDLGQSIHQGVTDTLLPEAFKEEGVFTGGLVVIGFALSVMLSAV